VNNPTTATRAPNLQSHFLTHDVKDIKHDDKDDNIPLAIENDMNVDTDTPPVQDPDCYKLNGF
jgi:hypothetical protein